MMGDVRLSLTPIEIGLTAAIVTVEDEEPAILAAGEAGGAQDEARTGLPFGPFDPLSHRTFEIGLRAWVEAQTGLTVGYVEQLYTFGDRGRHARPGDTGAHMVSVGYLALTRMSDNALRVPGAGFQPWYRFFPWEDWREARPAILDKTILPLLNEWAGQAGAEATRALGPARAAALHLRHRRQPVGRGARARPLRAALRGRADRGGAPRRARSRAGAQDPAGAGRADALRSPPHPRDRDRAAARQAQISPGGVRIDAARVHAHRIAAHGRSDLRAARAQAEFPPPGGERGTGRADRRDVDRDRRTAGGAVPISAATCWRSVRQPDCVSAAAGRSDGEDYAWPAVSNMAASIASRAPSPAQTTNWNAG